MKKTQLLFVSAILAISSSAFAADKHDHGHEHKPLHGGVVVEASDMDFELVAKADQISLHVRDHGKPASVQGASAKLTLLNGSEKSEVQLAPAGDKLEAKGSFKVGAGTKAVATVMLAGKKPVNVRFALK
ncbi:hypothetical protein [Paucibacter sp. M5-1]|uniref:hypothetical protein n=1 Tax=Paucibacter sp. M5-1 TaxID=3015998 RepID=UPI0010F46A66|nr:hypothetical protein [Paucibacter sp. M5-1]MCZ7883118.1 hypothetical protein [Paucibacter sp. M5-1]